MFEVQVQGKFKRLPEGEIFVGAESLYKLELGMITRSISKAAMAFAGNMVKDLQYSFGDDPDRSKDFQMPHVTSPMFPTFDKILITAPDHPLPPMGVPFVEDPEYRKERLKFGLTRQANIDLDTTFSFSVNTNNIDLEAWKLCGVPMVRPIDLRIILGGKIVETSVLYSCVVLLGFFSFPSIPSSSPPILFYVSSYPLLQTHPSS